MTPRPTPPPAASAPVGVLPPPPTNISTPRWKVGLALAFSLFLVAFLLALFDRSDPEAW